MGTSADTTLADVTRLAGELGVEYTSIRVDPDMGAVVVAVPLWGHRRLLDTALVRSGYQVEEQHLLGSRVWQLLVTPPTAGDRPQH